ncbi:ricin-type beta-trefoil lectin domain protein [Streptomyces hokutonensis]|uniref:ricin-type beta-trefoil lectin domain protein n=1 Tax=Streptomyces hokutonensis TaxID=1306990 RepID=UPI0036B31355
MEHTAGQPETPEEPALWERPLPWLRETEPASEAADESAEEPASPSEDGSAPDGENTPDATRAPATASDPAPSTNEISSAPGTLFRPRARRSDAPMPAPAPASPAASEPAASGVLFRPRAAPSADPTPASASAATTPAEPGTQEAAVAPGSLFRPRTTGSGHSGGQSETGAGNARPERSARVVGVAVAGCALLVLGIGSAAFIAMPGHDDSGPQAATVGDGVVPQLTAGGSEGPTGSPSSSGRPTHRTKGSKTDTDKGPHTEGSSSPEADTAHPGKASDTKAAQAASTGTGSTTTKTPTPKPAAAAAPGDEIVGYGSSKCIEVSAHSGVDGSPLRLWGCAAKAWQKWVFKSDGSVRSMGLCLDIANASKSDGAAIQLATCNGGWAQRFNLNSSHDLVNTVIGKCVDAKDQGTGNGTRLQLWSCGGTSNQKWHLG